MPYVPSEKTVPPAEDRKILDPIINKLAEAVAARITNNFSLIKEYKSVFKNTAHALRGLLSLGSVKIVDDGLVLLLASKIYEVGAKYEYEGAFLGEFNYAITRFIQLVPQIKVKRGEWKSKNEFRYWLYAATTSALIWASHYTEDWDIGLNGVFEDIKAEYKWKVNRSYEAAQIVKSGDCYDAPYYTRLIELTNENSKHIGYLDVLLKRDEGTLNVDVLPGRLVLTLKKNA